MLQIKKKNLLQCFLFVFIPFFNVLGGEGKEQKARHDPTAQNYLKLCFNYCNGHIVSGFASVTRATN